MQDCPCSARGSVSRGPWLATVAELAGARTLFFPPHPPKNDPPHQIQMSVFSLQLLLAGLGMNELLDVQLDECV